MYTINRLHRWYGALLWLVLSVAGAFFIGKFIGATNYLENWLGTMFKLTSAAWLAHWIFRDLFGSAKEAAGAPDQYMSARVIARALFIGLAMVAVCLAT
jgi:hypothetical protein